MTQTESNLTLYYVPASPPSRFVLSVIQHLELEKSSELKIVKISGQERDRIESEWFTINSSHTIPAIVDHSAGDLIVSEARAIAIYLVESRRPDHHLFPKDPMKRAVIHQRLCFESHTLTPRINKIIYPLILGEID